VLSEAFREFFAATAATAGTLTGLLFVALSVERSATRSAGAAVIHEVRTAAALLAFSNGLVVALFSLVPDTDVGYPATSFGVIGLLFTAAAVRSILTSGSTRRQQRQQIGLIRVLVLIFGTELIAGVIALIKPDSNTPAEIIGYALVASLIVGVGRAWELVGNRDTSLAASLAVLVGRTPRRFDDAGTDDPAGPQSQAGAEDDRSPGP
jgi:hypothetical protein